MCLCRGAFPVRVVDLTGESQPEISFLLQSAREAGEGALERCEFETGHEGGKAKRKKLQSNA